MSGSVLLTFACSVHDVEPLCAALRSVSSVPIHVRDEMVRGIDFADAGTAERVAGALRRAAIELAAPAELVEALIDQVRESRRRFPVRWRTTAIADEGRLS